jgi:hypothetical protein
MEYEYAKKYLKDLRRYKNNKALLSIVAKKIQHISKAKSLGEITELVAIRKTKSYYRIKIKLSENNVYRIGIAVLKNTIWFACIENDKKRFYKKFP